MVFYKLRNKWFGTTFVLCETVCGHTPTKKVYSSVSGLYVEGMMGAKLFLNKDHSFYGDACHGGDPVTWTKWVGDPYLSEMELHTLDKGE